MEQFEIVINTLAGQRIKASVFTGAFFVTVCEKRCTEHVEVFILSVIIICFVLDNHHNEIPKTKLPLRIK